jgi:hypothetical protein
LRETVSLRGEDYAGVDWRKIKAEYIAGGISQRKLAEKYGLPEWKLRQRAYHEKLGEKRKSAETKIEQTAIQKSAEIVADNATLLERTKTLLLRKLMKMVEAYPEDGYTEKRVMEDGAAMTYRIRDLAALYECLSDKIPKGMSADIEDLSPLAELLKDE